MFFKSKKNNRNQLYLEAARIIEKHGLNKDGGYEDENGALCIIGALAVAEAGNPQEAYQIYTNSEIMKDLTNAIWPEVRQEPWVRDIYNWNDNVASEQNVINALKKAAEL